jgi:hypothetical protein
MPGVRQDSLFLEKSPRFGMQQRLTAHQPDLSNISEESGELRRIFLERPRIRKLFLRKWTEMPELCSPGCSVPPGGTPRNAGSGALPKFCLRSGSNNPYRSGPIRSIAALAIFARVSRSCTSLNIASTHKSGSLSISSPSTPLRTKPAYGTTFE